MTGKERKAVSASGPGNAVNITSSDNNEERQNNVPEQQINNTTVVAAVDVSQQNGGPEKAPVVGGTNVETLPRTGKQGDPSTAFLRAARAGHLDKVLEYLNSGVDINSSNTNGLNALHLAAKDGHLKIVKELLSRGATVDAATKKGNTALHIASLAGQEEVVQLLVQQGASVNAQSQNGFTPLYMAAQENHDSVVKFLLSKGANQTLATEDGFTPLAVAMQQGHDKVVAILLENDTRGKFRLPALHIAAKKDDCKAVALLLQSNHNPDVTSKSGFTPLHIAAHYGNDRVASLLHEKGADVNFAAKHNITPMHVAAKWGKIKMVNLLISKGANIEAKTRDGLTPLHCAARSGHHEVVDILIEKGAPIGLKTKNGLAPLHMASQGDHVDAARILLYHRAPVDEVTVDYLTALHVAAHCGHVRVAKLLLDRNADPNARALNGFTPLHIACKKNRIKVVELLLKHKASIEATTESGLTPLHVASFMGCMNIVIYLLQHEASPDIPTVRGETPLHLAARANQTDIIRILLRNGAQVDARAREEQTPLHVASRMGNVDIVMLLLQHGADVDATTQDLYTPLHIAAKEGQEEVASVLLENGASLNATTKKGFTPLHLAAKYGNMNVARLLLQKNAPVDAQGKNGVTPLYVASHYDHQNVALLLLDKGASPHATAKNGHTPLHIAARKNQMDIATTLLEYGAKANAESKAGFTPLHLSAQEGHTDMSTLLIEHKADTNHRAKNGLTPLHLCAQEDKVNVASILVKNGAQVDAKTKAGYTPLHVAAHFGQAAMVRFLLSSGAFVDSSTSAGYTPLHQAAQQGHSLVINLLLESKASPNAHTNSGQTALDIAQKLGYITVVETLKIVTETIITTTHTVTIEEKYKVQAPESMQETFMSDSEDEGGGDEIGMAAMNVYGQPAHAQHVYLPSYNHGQMTYTREDPMLSDQHQYRYMNEDDMKSMGDDSMRVNVTDDDEKDNRHSGVPTITEMISKESYNRINAANRKPDNIDINRQPVHVGVSIESLNTSLAALGIVPKGQGMWRDRIPSWKNFLVSFLVDARGGAMRGCRHSGVRIIVPPRKATMPMRVTCRYLRRDKLTNPPPLMEGEALASRILELGPVAAKFLGPVIIEVPHFASLRGKEREIVILRSDNGETWREHTLEASEEAVQDVLNESFEGEELSQLEDLQTSRIVRILTVDFPHYFAVVSRIRQEVHAVGPEGGTVSSSAVPQVQAIFPPAALTKKIRVGLQAHPIPAELVAKLLGNRVAVSPIVTVEPRRRKFHKPIVLTIPVPQAANKGMINQYSGDAPTLRLLCSITGGQSRAVWEDVTGSTPLTFVKDCVSFTTTVSARFWLMDCRNISEATKMATELYTHATHVPFMAKFVVFAKRVDPLEARLRVFCMTDDKEDKTLEHQEHFTEVAKSRDVEVLEGKTQYMEFAGNLVPVLKSGEQLQLPFRAFKENRVPFTARVKDPDAADMMGRIMFMNEPKVPKGEPPQTPICTLNILLPEKISPITGNSELDLLQVSKNCSFSRDAGLSRPDSIHRATIRLTDISNLIDKDWEDLAQELNISNSEISQIKEEHPNNAAQQASAMFKVWQNNGNKATGNTLEKALNKIGRDDIVEKCIFNVKLVTDDVEKAVARVRLDQPGFDNLKEELGPSRNISFRRDEAIDPKTDPQYEEPDRMKDSESIEDLNISAEGQKVKHHIPMTNGNVYNATSTPIKDKYASDEKELGDVMAEFIEQKYHASDAIVKKSRDDIDDYNMKRQKIYEDAKQLVSGVNQEADKEMSAEKELARKGWSVVKSDDVNDALKSNDEVESGLKQQKYAMPIDYTVEPTIIRQQCVIETDGNRLIRTVETTTIIDKIDRDTTDFISAERDREQKTTAVVPDHDESSKDKWSSGIFSGIFKTSKLKKDKSKDSKDNTPLDHEAADDAKLATATLLEDMNKTASELSSEKEGVYLTTQTITIASPRDESISQEPNVSPNESRGDGHKEKSPGFFDKFISLKKSRSKKKPLSSGASLDSDDEGQKKMEDNVNSTWQNIDLIDENIDEHGQQKVIEKIQESTEETKVPENQSTPRDTTTSISFNGTEKVSGGGFLSKFISPKGKSKKEKRTESKEPSESKEIDMHPTDKENQILTGKFLQDTQTFSDLLEEKHVQPFEKQTAPEIQRTVVKPMKTAKSDGVNNIENPPEHKEKNSDLTNYSNMIKNDKDLRAITNSFLEDSRNAAGIIDACPYKSAYLYKGSQLRIENDESQQQNDDSKVDESVDHSRDKVKSKDKDDKKMKEKKGSNFLSGIFKGAKQASQEVTDDVKEFLDETKKEAIEEENRLKEEAKKEKAAKKTTVKDGLNPKVKDSEKHDDIPVVEVDFKQSTPPLQTTTTSTLDVKLTSKNDEIEKNMKQHKNTDKKKKAKKPVKHTDSTTSAESGDEGKNKEKSGGGGLLSGLLKSVKNAAEDVSEDVKVFVDETKTETIEEEKKLASLIDETIDKTLKDDSKETSKESGKIKKEKKATEKTSQADQRNQDELERSDKGVKIFLKMPKIEKKHESARSSVESQEIVKSNEIIHINTAKEVSAGSTGKEFQEPQINVKVTQRDNTNIDLTSKDSPIPSKSVEDDSSAETSNKKKKGKVEGIFKYSLFKNSKEKSVESTPDETNQSVREKKVDPVLTDKMIDVKIEEFSIDPKISVAVPDAGQSSEFLIHKERESSSMEKDTAAADKPIPKKKDKSSVGLNLKEIFKSTKHSASEIIDDVKDFAEETSREVEKEEDEIEKKLKKESKDLEKNVNKELKDTKKKVEGQLVDAHDKIVSVKNELTSKPRETNDLLDGEQIKSSVSVDSERAGIKAEIQLPEHDKKVKNKVGGFLSGIFKQKSQHKEDDDGKEVDASSNSDRKEKAKDKREKDNIKKSADTAEKHQDADKGIVTDTTVLAEITVKPKEVESNLKEVIDKTVEIDVKKKSENSKEQMELKIPKEIDKNIKQISVNDQSNVSIDLKGEKIGSEKDFVAIEIKSPLGEKIGRSRDSFVSKGKKEKDKGVQGFFSGIFKSTKNASAEIAKEVKEFVDETKQEALEEEKKTKAVAEKTIDDIEQMKKQATKDIQMTIDKASKSLEDGEKKAEANIKKMSSNITEKSKDAVEGLEKNLLDASVNIQTSTTNVVDELKNSVEDERNAIGKNMKNLEEKGLKCTNEKVKDVKEESKKFIDTIQEQLKQEIDTSLNVPTDVKVNVQVQNEGKVEEDIGKIKISSESSLPAVSKEGEEKHTGFLSGILQGAKNTVKKSSSEIKDFVEETKQEAINEEQSLKHDAKKTKDQLMTTIENESTSAQDKVKEKLRKIDQEVDSSLDSTISSVKKEKKKGEGFLSNIFKSAKHAADTESKKVKEIATNVEVSANKSTRGLSKKLDEKLSLGDNTFYEVSIDKPDDTLLPSDVKIDLPEVSGSVQLAEQRSAKSQEGKEDTKNEQSKDKKGKTKSDRFLFGILKGPKNVKEEIVHEVSEISNEAKQKAIEEGEKGKEKFSKALKDGKDKAAENAKKNLDKVSAEVSRTEEKMKTLVDEAENELANTAGAVDKKVTMQIEEGKNKAAENAKKTLDKVSAEVSRTEDKIKTLADGTKAELTNTASAVDEKVTTQIEKGTSKIKECKEQISKTVEEGKDKATESAKMTLDKVSAKVSRTEDKIKTLANGTKAELANTASAVDEKVTMKIEKGTSKIKECKEQISQILEEGKNKAAESAKKTLDQVSETEKKVKALADGAEADLKTAASVVDEKVTMKIEKGTSKIKEGKEQISQTLEEGKNKAAESAKKTLDQVSETEKKVKALADGAEADLKTAASVVDDKVTAKIEKGASKAKKGKEKSNSFLSGVLKSAKSTKEKIVDEVKEFAEKTKQIDSQEEGEGTKMKKSTESSEALMAKEPTVGSSKIVSVGTSDHQVFVKEGLQPMVAVDGAVDHTKENVTRLQQQQQQQQPDRGKSVDEVDSSKNVIYLVHPTDTKNATAVFLEDLKASSAITFKDEVESSSFAKQKEEDKNVANGEDKETKKKKKDKKGKEGGGILSGIVKKTKDAAESLKGLRYSGSYNVNPPDDEKVSSSNNNNKAINDVNVSESVLVTLDSLSSDEHDTVAESTIQPPVSSVTVLDVSRSTHTEPIGIVSSSSTHSKLHVSQTQTASTVIKRSVRTVAQTPPPSPAEFTDSASQEITDEAAKRAQAILADREPHSIKDRGLEAGYKSTDHTATVTTTTTTHRPEALNESSAEVVSRYELAGQARLQKRTPSSGEASAPGYGPEIWEPSGSGSADVSPGFITGTITASDTEESDGSPHRRRSSSLPKRRTLGSSSGSDVALHEGAELSPMEDDQENEFMQQNEPIFMETMTSDNDPEAYESFSSRTTNVTKTTTTTTTLTSEELRDSMQKIVEQFVTGERKDH